MLTLLSTTVSKLSTCMVHGFLEFVRISLMALLPSVQVVASMTQLENFITDLVGFVRQLVFGVFAVLTGI